jgi:hypothetical protein
MINRDIREQARLLRQQGKSIGEITSILEVSKSSVSNWVRDIVLSEEQIQKLKANQRRYGAQNSGAKLNQAVAKSKREFYQQAGREAAREGRQLHLIGCMLYWAEGAKARNAIYFANSDPNMMLLFTRFLREELKVEDKDIRLLIHCHSDNPAEIQRIETYWLDLLKLPASSLNKTQIKKGSDTRKNRLVNGVCSIRVFSTELTHHIYGAIQEYGGFENPAWLY